MSETRASIQWRAVTVTGKVALLGARGLVLWSKISDHRQHGRVTGRRVRRHQYKLDVVAHGCHPNTGRQRQEGHEVAVSLDSLSQSF